ncbi:MAG: hypothetical protein LBC02_09320, partial [Planctomycetaceae bacterium]|nr:hypothetical protein [Planctomycetaceae bacterium]
MTRVIMDNEFIIANPIYDVAFVELIDDTENAHFFIETLLNQEVCSVEFKPQQSPLSIETSGITRFLQTDFIATIKTITGDSQKILIEFCKGAKTLSSWWLRRHLSQRYKPANEVKLPLHTITVYILTFELKHIPTPVAKITREYVDLITKQPFSVKEDFAPNLHHDYIIVQIPQIHHKVTTQLEAILSLFEQNYFVDDDGHFKKNYQPYPNRHILRMVNALFRVANSEECRRMLDTEDSINRVVNGEFNEEM